MDAARSFDGPLPSRHLAAIDLSVRGHVPELDERTFGEMASAPRHGYLRASGARDDIASGLEAVLEEPAPSR